MTYRVTFKYEDATPKGEPIGPVFVESGPEPDPQVLGRPYQRKCVCDEGDPGELNEWGYPVCKSCGNEMPATWVTFSQAQAIAQEYDTELIET